MRDTNDLEAGRVVTRGVRQAHASGAMDAMPLSAETYEIIASDAAPALIILCDHAGNAFPQGYGTLGLPAEQIARHIGYDIGAGAVVRAMAKRLNATAVLSKYSRLLIDLNRGADDPTLIMKLSDGAIVPGNRHIDQAETQRRIALYYNPYHRAVRWAIDRALAIGTPPMIVSIHSFTPAWKDQARPWHVSVLWDRDPRLAQPMLTQLRADTGLCVGENQPYLGKLEGDSLHRHGLARGLAHALIEVRQDLIADDAGCAAWADRLANAMTAIVSDAVAAQELSLVRFHGAGSSSGLAEPREPDIVPVDLNATTPAPWLREQGNDAARPPVLTSPTTDVHVL